MFFVHLCVFVPLWRPSLARRRLQRPDPDVAIAHGIAVILQFQ